MAWRIPRNAVLYGSGPLAVGLLLPSPWRMGQDRMKTSDAPLHATAQCIQLPPDNNNKIAPSHNLAPINVSKYGLPDFRARESYVVSYDRRTRTPNYVLERLTPENFASSKTSRDGVEFVEDETIPELFRARLADYRKSGFDRGHLAPAGNHKWSPKAMKDTFILTNICPQVGKGFNRDYWARLEQLVRQTAQANDEVYCMTGPAFVPEKAADGKYYVKYQVLGEPANTAVPTHFWKVVLVRKGDMLQVGAFLLPNQPIPEDTPLSKFIVPLEKLERVTGQQFFDKIPRKAVKHLCSGSNCVLPPPGFWVKPPKKGKVKTE